MKRWTERLYAHVIRSRLPVYFAVLVLFVILLLIAPLYLAYAGKLKTQISLIGASQLSQLQASLDNILKEIDRSSIKLSEDISVKRFIFLERNRLFSGEEDYQLFLKRMFDVLSNEEKFYSNMASIYLYVPQTDKVITGTQAIELDAFEDRTLLRTIMQDEVGSYRWLGKRTTTVFRVHGDPAEKEVITFYRKFSNDGVVTEAVLMINVQVELLQKFLREFDSEYPLALRITDAGHGLIYSDAKHMALDEEELALIAGEGAEANDYIVSSVSSRYSQWDYTVVIAKSWLFAPMLFISRMTFILTVVVLLFGLLVSIYLSRRFFKPFEATLSRWQGGHGSEPAVIGTELFHDKIKRLVSSTEAYGKVLDHNRGMIKNRILLDLLKKNQWTDMDMIAIDVKPNGCYYQVCSVIMDDGQELSEQDRELILYAAVNIVRETIEQHARPLFRLETALLDGSSFAVILSASDAGGAEVGRDELHEALEEMQRMLRDFLKYSWTFGVGGAYGLDSMLSESYRESSIAVSHRIYRGKGSIIYFQDLHVPSRIPILDEWIKYKDAIISAVRARDESKLTDTIGQLVWWLQQYPDATMNHIDYIFYSVLMDIEKIIYELNIDRKVVFSHEQSIFALVDSCQTVVEMEKLLTATCETMIAYLASKQFAAKSSLIGAVVDYLQAQYGHEHISLESTAARFSMNPSYLGQLMKKELKKTFLQFLSELRIEQAKERLVHSSKTIQEISAEVGYSNRSTFIRVFKNIVGITPSDYRNRFIKGETRGEAANERP